MLLLGYALFGMLPLTVKLLSSLGLSTAQIVFFRFLFCSLFVVAVATFRLQELRAYNKTALLVRGLSGGLSVFLWFLALEYTTASKGTMLSYTNSMWANVFNAVFLRQQPHRGFWFILAIALSGVWLVLDPSFDSFNKGDTLALLAAACGGVAILSIKEARRTDNAISVFASFSWIGLLISALFLALPVGAVAPAPWGQVFTAWPILSGLLLMGAVSTAGQLFFTQGYGNASVALGTILSLLVPVVASGGACFLLGETLSIRFLCGAALILSACAVSGIREARKSLAVEEAL